MIQLTSIELKGESVAGPFGAALTLEPGLQVIAAGNAFGKSLAAKVIAWCLGLEPMFGVQDNDPACFPLAAREEIDLGGRVVAVLSSECSVALLHEDSHRLRLSRQIKGDPSNVRVEESSADGTIRTSILRARLRTMQDEHGGLQRFLFDWLGWPRAQVATFKGTVVDVYLENLAPLFYVEQDEGWTDLQARQISRYAQHQIGQVAVEFLLGATDVIALRLAVQTAHFKAAVLREAARNLAEQVTTVFARNGWNADWSGYGTVAEITTRWSSRTLSEVLREDANVDLVAQVASLRERAETIRRALTTEPIDPANASAHSAASQKVIALKGRRHELAQELRTLRGQYDQAELLMESLEHRLHAASDVLRLKTTGVGRLTDVECPTCHRHLDPATFNLTEQSGEAVKAHIEALKRDRDVMKKNRDGIARRLVTVQTEAAQLESQFRDAERALMTVTVAVGTVREQLAQIAANLAAVEREIDRLVETAAALETLQKRIGDWIVEAHNVQKTITSGPESPARIEAFTEALREYLVALGHSAVTTANATGIRLDENYIPYLGTRRLQSLGSASDRSRLIAAYSLALAAASLQVNGLHPGVVIFDEPLQQNPDDPHRHLFTAFLSKQLALQTQFQTVIFTSLRQTEIDLLRGQGSTVVTPEGQHFLKPLTRGNPA